MTKLEIEHIKDQIKQKLSTKEIVEFYIGNANEYNKRYKCPFNKNEHKCNFEIKGKYWRCFSCNESGDEILFVQKLFGLNDYIDTLKKIAQDFNLETTVKYDKDYAKKIEKLKKEKLEKEENEQKLIVFERKLFDLMIKRQNELVEIIAKNEPYNVNKMNIYARTSRVDTVMNAVNQYNKNEVLLSILLQYDISLYDSAIYGPAVTIGEKKELKNNVLRDIMNKEIKINKKGDVISAYGYK